ncbi:kinase-like protein, partial [Rhizoctonia solani]
DISEEVQEECGGEEEHTAHSLWLTNDKQALENVENSGLPGTVMTGKTEAQRWMAPELFAEEPVLETPCDVWGWAMATLEIVSGSVPYYKHKQAITVMNKVMQGPPTSADHLEFNTYAYRPTEMWGLLEKCWKQNPEDRLSMDEVVIELKKIAKMPEIV